MVETPKRVIIINRHEGITHEERTAAAVIAWMAGERGNAVIIVSGLGDDLIPLYTSESPNSSSNSSQ